jgi:acyl-CoA synthetase (AMP-forming)/AMP-acid ligase II
MSGGNTVPRDSTTPGEILVQSDANMVGYWRRSDLTAQTIRNGWMHTGDIAVWDDDGYIFIVDRAKDMIISGGENIYSTQVEAAIHQHPAVLESAVFGIPDPEWGESVKGGGGSEAGDDGDREEIIATRVVTSPPTRSRARSTSSKACRRRPQARS